MSEITDPSAPPAEAAPEVISWGDAWTLCYEEMVSSDMSETLSRKDVAPDWIVRHHRRRKQMFEKLCKLISAMADDDVIKYRLREMKAEEDEAAALAAGLSDSEVADGE